jgi:hypothetical protein
MGLHLVQTLSERERMQRRLRRSPSVVFAFVGPRPRGEQSLTDASEGEAVLDLRRRWQRVMRVELVGPGWVAAMAFGTLVLLHSMLVAALAARYSRALPVVSRRRSLLAYTPLLVSVPVFPRLGRLRNRRRPGRCVQAPPHASG